MVMDTEESSEEDRTVFCGNLSEDLTEALLFELFNQAGPVQSIRRPKDPSGRPKSFAFVVYKHECSVPYAVELFRLTKLFNRNLTVNTRNRLRHKPVLDTHLTEFTDFDNDKNSEYSFREKDSRNMRGREEQHRRGRHRRGEFERSHNEYEENNHRKDKDRDQNEPKNWAELNALRKSNLQSSSHCKQESSNNLMPPMMPDFNALLQMGQQLMIPGMQGIPGMPGIPGIPVMGGPAFGHNNMYPSMEGRMNGGERNFDPRERDRRDHSRRDSHRHHPYNERHYSDRREDHKRQDRGVSSSHSSHDRERRDRRRH